MVQFLNGHLNLQVEERLVTVDELLDADEVFCTGTAVVVSPVGSITYRGKRYKTLGYLVNVSKTVSSCYNLFNYWFHYILLN